MSKDKQNRTVQTTGHAWDGDLQEFNNPLPNWWLWGFYATVVFAIIYWFLYPAWPIGDSYTKGVGNQVEYTTQDGKQVKTHWNTRALYQRELQVAREARQEFVAGLKDLSYAAILQDANKRDFALSTAKVLFADNCAACHQPGGAGLAGSYPSLVDDDWIWGGSFKQVEETIRKGHKGNMPGFGQRLSDKQISAVAEYVLSLSGQNEDQQLAQRGKEIFEGQAACYSCHTKSGEGNTAMGAANLTDQIWTVAKIDSRTSHEEKLKEIRAIVKGGISRTMPAWEERFTDTEIKMLTLYVHELGSN
ncbi:MAG: cytochrome-c oxidase, cbb3-type subunit III [Thioalkalispiraceae bacterium]|jgi:cytochrome c oxidase cbb3-type subunit 3